MKHFIDRYHVNKKIREHLSDLVAVVRTFESNQPFYTYRIKKQEKIGAYMVLY